MGNGRLTLVHLNDTHAHLEPHWELEWRRGRPDVWRAGGFGHIAALAKEARRAAGGASLFVDSGDEIHGTGVAQWTEGAALVPALNALEIDVFTPGNWEFGYGPEVLRTRVGEMRFPVLAWNVRTAVSGAPAFGTTEVRELGGVRVGLIGITTPIVGLTMPQPFGSGLRFLGAEDGFAGAIERLRREEKVDLLVVVSHYGFPQEVEIARRIDGIDVILGGHTHDVLRRPAVVGRTIITQGGAHGSYLTRLELEVAQGRVVDYRHTLLPVRAEGAEDGEVEAVVEEATSPYRARLDEVVGETRTLLHRGTVLEAPMDDLITDAYLAATGADVALSHGWRYGAPIPPGPITASDLWQMIPPNPELFTAKVTGEELRQLLEASLENVFAGEPLRQKGGYLIRTSGIAAGARLNNPRGHRVETLEVAGEPWDAEREYTIAAAGAQSVPEGVTRNPAGMHALDAVRAHLARGPFAAGEHSAKFVAS